MQDLDMYFDQYFSFYNVYANPFLYEGERMHEQEFELMKSYYPITVQQIQESVERECDLLDYEGSSLYDEYPDRYLFYHLCSKIKESVLPEMTSQSIPGSFLDELVQVMFCQEVSRRRCRRHRCRGCFGI